MGPGEVRGRVTDRGSRSKVAGSRRFFGCPATIPGAAPAEACTKTASFGVAPPPWPPKAPQEETGPASGGYAPLMVTDGPIPFVPYLCGALAATALMARSTGCGGSCTTTDLVPGMVRLLIYTIIVVTGAWIWVTDWGSRVLGVFLFFAADWVLMDRDERRAFHRRLTDPMTPGQIVVGLAPIVFFAGAMIVLTVLRIAPASRPPVQPLPDHAVADPVQAAFAGAMVVLFTSKLPRLWWLQLAASAASRTPRSP